jgi:hypothetical protein
MTILPPAPATAAPVFNEIDPDAPELVVPDVNDKLPLIPLVPASGVRSTTSPLDLAVPKPDAIEMCPPVFVVLMPPTASKFPLKEEAEVPAVMMMDPLLAPVPADAPVVN